MRMCEKILAVLAAFLSNRLSSNISNCKSSGLTPRFATIMYGLSIVVYLIHRKSLYPGFLPRICNIFLIFIFNYVASYLILELGYCFWTMLEIFFFFKLPAIIEQLQSPILCNFVNSILDSPCIIATGSNLLSLFIFFYVLDHTGMCNLNILSCLGICDIWSSLSKVFRCFAPCQAACGSKRDSRKCSPSPRRRRCREPSTPPSSEEDNKSTRSSVDRRRPDTKLTDAERIQRALDEVDRGSFGELGEECEASYQEQTSVHQSFLGHWEHVITRCTVLLVLYLIPLHHRLLRLK